MKINMKNKLIRPISLTAFTLMGVVSGNNISIASCGNPSTEDEYKSLSNPKTATLPYRGTDDAALAQALANADLNADRPLVLEENELLLLKELQDKAQKFRQDSDVHAYNATIKPQAQAFLNLINKYIKPKEDSSLESQLSILQTAIKDHKEENKKAPALRIVEIIRQTALLNPVDSETGINVPKLISALVFLVNQNSELLKRKIEAEEKIEDFTTVLALNFQSPEQETWNPIVLSLAENLETQGGCYPGIVGRLFCQFFLHGSSRLYQIPI